MYDILYGINQPREQRGAGVWGERGMGGPYIYIIYIGAPHVPHVSAILFVVTRVTKTNHRHLSFLSLAQKTAFRRRTCALHGKEEFFYFYRVINCLHPSILIRNKCIVENS